VGRAARRSTGAHARTSVFAHFFRAGQVLPTDRGRGVFQPALDAALDRLAAGDWVHLFPEGYVNMSRRALCRRFKWGIGRLLLEAEPHARPVVCPIWIEGESCRVRCVVCGVRCGAAC